MSDSKSKAVIGAFVVGAIALAVAGVLVLGGGEFMKKKMTRIMYFDHSVKGLKVGAPVVFQGVTIGTVKEISVRANTKDWTFKVPVIVEFDPSTYRDPDLKVDSEKAMTILIERGLRAQLELQSVVTGMLQIALELKPGTEARLVGGDQPYPEIPTTASGIEKLAQQLKELPLKEIINEISETLVSIRDLAGSPELRDSINNLNQTILAVKELVRHADAEVVGAAAQLLNDADQMVVALDGQMRPLVGKADKAVTDIDKLVNNVDQAVGPLARKIGTTADSFKTTAEAVRPALKTAEKALANIEAMTREDSGTREKLDDTLKELSAAARSIKNWADYLERHPEALILGKGKAGQRR